MKKLFALTFFFAYILQLYSENNTLSNSVDSTVYYKYKYCFPIIIQDSPAQLFTMRQSNQNYLSAYRFLIHQINKTASNKTSTLFQMGLTAFLYPFTHEEGHRSVLTSLGIGSVSQPFFNSKGAAYVNGVRDADLISLRDHDLPNYIRLHTAGLEADYTLSLKEEEAILFGFERKQNLYLEVVFRKLSTMGYYTLSLVPSMSPNIDEEPNELKRDIVGHDVYGAIKNLFRPNIQFYRYTDYDNLTADERRFVKRVGCRALLNLGSPLFFNQLNFIQNKSLRLSLGTGYTMCPFGDFIDENVWVKYQNRYNIHAYLRQFENRNNWFFGGGLALVDYQLSPKLSASASSHFWNQPLNLDFNTSKSRFGASGNALLKYRIISNTSGNALSLDFGLNCKTYGFLPEEVMLKDNIGISVGISLYTR